MNALLFSVFVAIAPCSLLAQQIAGIENDYQARNLVQAAIKADQDLRPILATLNPRQWYEEKGAPSTYNLQLQTAQNELRYVEIAGDQVLLHIESLPPLIDLYYRMEALELTARALDQGAKQYAPRPQADKLDQWVGQGFEARRRMREYIEDLATSLEQNFKIADEEAQRCRAAITQVPPKRKGRESAPPDSRGTH